MEMESKADIAVIGLAVMGQNLILNMNDHGYTVVAFNRTVSKVDDFLNNEAKGTKVIGAHSLEEMAALLKKPRRVMLMVKARKPVDEFIEHLLPVLEPGDIIIDGGNSLFEDTIRRTNSAGPGSSVTGFHPSAIRVTAGVRSSNSDASPSLLRHAPHTMFVNSPTPSKSCASGGVGASFHRSGSSSRSSSGSVRSIRLRTSERYSTGLIPFRVHDATSE